MIFTKSIFKMRIAFIINPISGVKNKKKIEQLILKMFKVPDYSVVIVKTGYPEHAKKLAAELASENYDVIVAVGGDGTLNEVSAGLINTQSILGLVPCGSGDGLARHLKISKNPKKALERIKNVDIHYIDMVVINETSFINVAGIGFDAYVAHNFAKCNKRGFFSYIKQILKQYISYKPFEATISCNRGNTIKRKAFLIEFANSSQFGNEAVISPLSITNDGIIEICILKPFHWYNLPYIVILLFLKKLHKSKFLEIIQTGEVKVETQEKIPAHIDGNPFIIDNNFHVKIVPKALRIIY